MAVSTEVLRPTHCYYGEKTNTSVTDINVSGVSNGTRYNLYKADVDIYNANPSDPKFKDTAMNDLGWDANGTPRGMIYTNTLIVERNKRVIEAKVTAPTKDNFATLLEAAGATTEENKKARRLLYYPAASYCQFYQPSVDALNDKFKSGNWFLPSIGELIQIWYMIRHSGKAAASQYNKINSNNIVWSSSEHDLEYAWAIRFKTSWEYDNIAGNTTSNGYFGRKSWDVDYPNNTYLLLPVVSF